MLHSSHAGDPWLEWMRLIALHVSSLCPSEQNSQSIYYSCTKREIPFDPWFFESIQAAMNQQYHWTIWAVHLLVTIQCLPS